MDGTSENISIVLSDTKVDINNTNIKAISTIFHKKNFSTVIYLPKNKK